MSIDILADKNKKYKQVQIICILLSSVLVFAFFWDFYWKYLSLVSFVHHDDMYLHGMIALRIEDAIHHGTAGIQNYLATDSYPQVITYPGWHMLVFVIYEKILKVVSMGLENSVQALIFSEVAVNAFFMTLTYNVVLAAFHFRIKWIPASILLLFVGPIYAIPLIGRYYLGGYTPNVWHNPTYIAVRPLGMMVVLLCIRIFSNKEEKIRNYLMVSILLVFTALLKPSFYQMFIPGLVVFCLWYVFLKYNKRAFFRCVLVAFSCVPLGVLALMQYFMTFGSSSAKLGGGLAVGILYVWGYYTKAVGWSIITSMLFPVLVFVVATVRKKFTISLGISALSLASGFCWYALCYYKQKPFTADFSWGFDLALFIAFVLCLRWVLTEAGDWFRTDKRKGLLPVLVVLLGCFVWHLSSGIWYFKSILPNGTFFF